MRAAGLLVQRVSVVKALYPQYIVDWPKDFVAIKPLTRAARSVRDALAKECPGVNALKHHARGAWEIKLACDVAADSIVMSSVLPAPIRKFTDTLNSSLWDRAYHQYLSLLINTCSFKGEDILMTACLGHRSFELRRNSRIRTITPVSATKDLPSLHKELEELFHKHNFGVYRLGKTDIAGAKRVGSDQFYPVGWENVTWYALVDPSIDFEWFRPVPPRTRAVPINARLLTDPRVAAQMVIDSPAIPAFKCVQCGQDAQGFYYNKDAPGRFTCSSCWREYTADGVSRDTGHGVKLI